MTIIFLSGGLGYGYGGYGYGHGLGYATYAAPVVTTVYRGVGAYGYHGW